MRRTLLLAVLAGAAACQSTGPYSVPAAALNTAVAVGASAARRAGGDCFTPCTGGRVCTPRTGYCEAPVAEQVCDQGETGMVRCAPISVTQRQAPLPPNLAPGFGISPQTGQAPPPPAEASPRPAPEAR